MIWISGVIYPGGRKDFDELGTKTMHIFYGSLYE
jgi:hypothetical protein